MTATDEIQAAAERLTALKKDSTQGRWFWELPSEDSFPQSDESLLATAGEWYTCTYYCQFNESNTSRGQSGQPGHEHLRTESVLSGWGYDASGIHGSDTDRELIVTLHRTIDAQLAILRGALTRPASTFDMREYDLEALALARAINTSTL